MAEEVGEARTGFRFIGDDEQDLPETVKMSLESMRRFEAQKAAGRELSEVERTAIKWREAEKTLERDYSKLEMVEILRMQDDISAKCNTVRAAIDNLIEEKGKG